MMDGSIWTSHSVGPPQHSQRSCEEEEEAWGARLESRWECLDEGRRECWGLDRNRGEWPESRR